MTRRLLSTLIVAPVAVVAVACSSAGSSDGSASPDDPSSASQALTTVVDCQTQSLACIRAAKAPADVTTCNEGFRQCLTSVAQQSGFALPDAGLPTLPTRDAGLPTVPTLPTRDAGLPTVPTLPTFDAGLPTVPPVFGDAGIALPPGQDCVVQLNTCALQTPDPAACATQAQACLKTAANAQCDQRYQACKAASLPNCDPLHAACTIK